MQAPPLSACIISSKKRECKHDNNACKCGALKHSIHFVEIAAADHGRIETRRVWCQTALNAYLDFPYVGQVFLIEHESLKKNRRGLA
jgi:hypothetical protein